MKPLFEDTHPEIERRLLELYRLMTPAEKFRRVRELGLRAQDFALSDVRRLYPFADARECRFRAAARRFSPDVMRDAFGWDPDAGRFGERGLDKPLDAHTVVRAVVPVLEMLNVLYAIGGSLASSTYGNSRFTEDVDFVVAMTEEQGIAFAEALQREFYADEEMILDALRTRTSFNVIHLPTSYKADFFPAADDAVSLQELARRRHSVISRDADGGALAAYVVSPEDIVLQKLRWFRMTGESSERQWGDVQGVLHQQRSTLDFAYLREWGGRMALSDLLLRALTDAGLEARADADGDAP